jgi:hypothetical protein
MRTSPTLPAAMPTWLARLALSLWQVLKFLNLMFET